MLAFREKSSSSRVEFRRETQAHNLKAAQKLIQQLIQKPRWREPSGAFAYDRTASVFGAIQKHELSLKSSPVGARDLKGSPARHMRRHQRLKQAAVVWHAQVKQFVGNDEILEAVRFIEQIGRERDCAGARTRTPFARHALNANKAGVHS